MAVDEARQHTGQKTYTEKDIARVCIYIFMFVCVCARAVAFIPPLHMKSISINQCKIILATSLSYYNPHNLAPAAAVEGGNYG